MTEQIAAALALIQPHQVVSLGGGRHMQALADGIVARVLPGIQICSPSEVTLAYCQILGLPTTTQIASDIAFDGCDSADKDLNLLKSNGGIHFYEKLHAQASHAYVILTAQKNVNAQLNAAVPLTLEVVSAASEQVMASAKLLGLQAKRRVATTYMGYTRTRDGNELIDCTMAEWTDIAKVDHLLASLPGVVATSYFAHLATLLLIETPDGQVHEIKQSVNQPG